MDRRSLLQGAVAVPFAAMVSGCEPVTDVFSAILNAAPKEKFIVVWQDGDEAESQILARVFEPGKNTWRFEPKPVQPISSGSGSQRLPAVAASESGFVVTWVESGDWSVRIKGFDLDGNGLFSDIVEANVPWLPTPSWSKPLLGPRIAMARDGNFVVCWDRGTGHSSRAHRYSPNGNRLGSYIETTDATGPGSGFLSDVAIADDGSFAVTYSRPVSGGAVGGPTFVRGFDSNGAIKFGPINLEGMAYRQAIAMSPDGSKVIVAQARQKEADKAQLVAHIVPVGEDQPAISTKTVYLGKLVTPNEMFPAVAINKAGRFCVVWQDDRIQPPRTDIRGRFFAPDGAPEGPDFVVSSNQENERRFYPVIATNRAQAFVIVWEKIRMDGTKVKKPVLEPGDAFVQMLLAPGIGYIHDRRVNSDPSGRQAMPRVAMVPTTSSQP